MVEERERDPKLFRQQVTQKYKLMTYSTCERKVKKRLWIYNSTSQIKTFFTRKTANCVLSPLANMKLYYMKCNTVISPHFCFQQKLK